MDSRKLERIDWYKANLPQKRQYNKGRQRKGRAKVVIAQTYNELYTKGYNLLANIPPIENSDLRVLQKSVESLLDFWPAALEHLNKRNRNPSPYVTPVPDGEVTSVPPLPNLTIES